MDKNRNNVTCHIATLNSSTYRYSSIHLFAMLFIHSLIHLFNNYLLRAFQEPGPVLGTTQVWVLF